jgi:Flp pilus assembly pilin Flp
MSSGTAAEYGVIAAAIFLVLAAVIFFFGHDIANTFTVLRDAFTPAS